MKRLISVFAALMLAGPALADDVTVNGIHVIHPWIPVPAAATMGGAGYMSISNEGTTADRLRGAETDIAMMAALHETVFGTDGVARMFELPPVDLAPGETISFAPGGAHLMLMMLTAQLKEGDKVPITLFFDNAGEVVVEFVVEAGN